MSSRTLRLILATRVDADGRSESLSFKQGLNLLVGRPNTGKTGWLRLIDYVLGSTKPTPEEAVGEVLAQRYVSCKVQLEAGGKEYELERRWHEYGGRTKLFLDQHAIDPDEFSQFLLTELEMPTVRYPKGSPYGGSWANLSWRTLYRHVYRREDQWTELMPKQPDGEFHACVLEFCGLAQAVFPEALGALVDRRRELETLIARRDNYLATLQEITREVLNLNLPDGELAAGALDQYARELETEKAGLLGERATLVKRDPSALTGDETQKAAQQSRDLDSLRDLVSSVESAERRRSELKRHAALLTTQLTSLKRALIAGRTLGPLKTTCCPVCDAPVTPRVDTTTCYLCGRPSAGTAHGGVDHSRIEFEMAQTEEELSENSQLVDSIGKSIADTRAKVATLRARIDNRELATKVSEASDRTGADQAVQRIDLALGSIVEREQQLNNVRRVLAQGDSIASEVDALEVRIVDLERQIELAQTNADFDSASDVLSEGMNEYFVRLNEAAGERLWPFGEEAVTLSVRKNGVSPLVDGRSYRSKLGGIMSLYFFIAYHYSLIRLVGVAGYHFPGLLLLDFPPDRTAAALGMSSLDRTEGFALQPFLELMRSRTDMQVVATGHRYHDLPGHRIVQNEVFGAD